jgi:hypothetical protein
MHFIIKLDFFRNNKSDSWEMHDLYTTDKALSNAHFKVSLYSLLFFSIFFLQTVQYGRNSPIYGARKRRKWVMKKLKQIFLDKKSVTKVVEEFFDVLCSKIFVSFEKHLELHSFIYCCTRHFALSNKKRSSLYDIPSQSYIKNKINAKLLHHPLSDDRLHLYK